MKMSQIKTKIETYLAQYLINLLIKYLNDLDLSGEKFITIGSITITIDDQGNILITGIKKIAMTYQLGYFGRNQGNTLSEIEAWSKEETQKQFDKIEKARQQQGKILQQKMREGGCSKMIKQQTLNYSVPTTIKE